MKKKFQRKFVSLTFYVPNTQINQLLKKTNNKKIILEMLYPSRCPRSLQFLNQQNPISLIICINIHTSIDLKTKVSQKLGQQTCKKNRRRLRNQILNLHIYFIINCSYVAFVDVWFLKFQPKTNYKTNIRKIAKSKQNKRKKSSPKDWISRTCFYLSLSSLSEFQCSLHERTKERRKKIWLGLMEKSRFKFFYWNKSRKQHG